MNIVDTRRKTSMFFRNVAPGDAFLYKDKLHIKSREAYTKTAFSLDDNELKDFDPDMLVDPVEIEVHIVRDK